MADPRTYQLGLIRRADIAQIVGNNPRAVSGIEELQRAALEHAPSDIAAAQTSADNAQAAADAAQATANTAEADAQTGITNAAAAQSTANTALANAAAAQATADSKLSDAPSDGNTYARKNGAWVVESGGGGTGNTPVVRAATCTALASVSSTSVSWPTGTVAGDVVIIFAGHGWNVITPSGWTSLDNTTGTNWNGACIGKVMTSADITAGSVTVTFGGGFNGVVAAVTLKGTTTNQFVSKASRQSSSGVISTSVAPLGTLSTDLILCFASTRANTTCATTGSTDLASQSGSNASGDVASVTGVSGVFGATVTNTFGAAGTGFYVCAAAFR